MPLRAYRSTGFTLTELAVVLVIVALLLGGVMGPLSIQNDVRKTSETEAQLREIREALLGFAAVNGRLPCPDTTNDPTDASYGIEESSCGSDPTSEGFLPWKTLGVREFDAWGSPWTNATQPRLGHWRYRIERQYANSTNIKSLILSPGTGGYPAPFPDDSLSIKNAAGQFLNTTSERPIAIVFSVGPNNQADGENSSFEKKASSNPTYQADIRSGNFDDILIWISRPVLANHMIAAGKLP